MPRLGRGLLWAASASWLLLGGATAHQPLASFSHLVDSYLERFGHYHPSIAAGNGLHDHDGELEDFSAPSIASEITWLHATRRSLDALDDRTLSADERVDRRILQGVVDGWLLDLETVRTWTRNPMIYVGSPGTELEFAL